MTENTIRKNFQSGLKILKIRRMIFTISIRLVCSVNF